MVSLRSNFIVICIFLMQITSSLAWDNEDLELFDLVEDIQGNFYDFLGIEKTATVSDIRKAYRKLSLQYHPDKNKEEGTEEKFRKIVAVSEVLKNADLRRRYNEILEYGLPSWREPVYYYRKVRKMGLLEMSVLVSVIMTVGHYIVAWAAYWEKRFEMECLMPKKRRDKKAKKTKKQWEEDDEEVQLPDDILEKLNISRPKITDLLPFQVVGFFRSQIMRIPFIFTSLKICVINRTRKLSIEDESEEVEDKRKVRKRTKVVASYSAEPVAISSSAGPVVYNLVRNGTTVVDETANKMENKMGKDWSADDANKLVRCMAKYPGGTTERWQKIAGELERSVDEVLKKCKSIKSESFAVNVEASRQGIVRGIDDAVTSKSGKINCTEEISVRNNFESTNADNNHRHKPAKSVKKTAERTLLITNSTSTDNSNTIVGEEDSKVASATWTQVQQKLFEKALAMIPKGTSDRFSKVAEEVPGKTKEQCILRYKDLVEMVRNKRVTAAS